MKSENLNFILGGYSQIGVVFFMLLVRKKELTIDTPIGMVIGFSIFTLFLILFEKKVPKDAIKRRRKK